MTVTCVAFVAVTVKVEELPELTEDGLAVIVTVTAGSAITDTAAVAVAFPPLPVAVAV